jgi:hypothetical protein
MYYLYGMDKHPNSDTSWVGQDKTGLDLRYQDLSARTLFQTDLRGSKLYGAKIALTCGQFDGVRLDDEQVAALLFMLYQADISPEWQSGLEALIYEVAGHGVAARLHRFMKLA